MKRNFGCLILFLSSVLALPEQGIWQLSFNNKDNYHAVYKSMYQGTRVALKVECKSQTGGVKLNIGWVLRYTPCAEEYIGLESNVRAAEVYYEKPDRQMIDVFKYDTFEYTWNETTAICSGVPIVLPDLTKMKPIIVTRKLNATDEAGTPKLVTEGTPQKSKDKITTPKPTTIATTAKASKKSKRAAIQKGKPATNNDTTPAPGPGAIDHHYVTQTWRDGYFLFILKVQPEDPKNKFEVDIQVSMLGKYGYISAVEWPLLIFYGVMGITYIFYGIVWLVMLACSWRDLLRVQFWIGGVIVLGMLEKAVFYAEYQSITNTGQSVRGAVVFAELVSCLKRMLARMLVIIVSLGFGIVKPRLGPAFHKVLCVGGVYFILGSIEGCMRALKPKGDQSSDVMIAAVPLAVVDASICWWIFSSLIQTTRTLRLRRNIVKLSLYRHFTNTLIFAVLEVLLYFAMCIFVILASVIYMIWSITQHKMKTCVTDWKELWVDDAFWHLLFSVILLVIMVLWRPTANNQRFAFSPLLDAADDEDEDETSMNDAFEGMKMRGKQANGSPKQRSIDDDLKWVEENIPTSVTDKALPSLLDSDEEMMTTKYEMSKMQ